MAVSGSIDFASTGNHIIEDALRVITVHKRGMSLANEDVVEARRALNRIMKQWNEAGDGAASMKMWLRERGVLIPSLSTFEYTLGGSGESSGVCPLSELNTTQLVDAMTPDDNIVGGLLNGRRIAVGDVIGFLSSDTGNYVWRTVSALGGAMQSSDDNFDDNFLKGHTVWDASFALDWAIDHGVLGHVNFGSNIIESSTDLIDGATGTYSVILTFSVLSGTGMRPVLADTNGTTRTEAGTYHELITGTATQTLALDPIDSSTSAGITLAHVHPRITLNAGIGHDIAAGSTVYWYTPGKLGKPRHIVSMVRRQANGDDTPLDRMSRVSYDAYPDKDNTGDPTAFHLQENRDDATLFLDAGPTDINDQLRFTYMREVNDVDVGTDNVDFPKVWERALVYQLAKDLAPMYGKTLSKDAEDTRVEAINTARYTNPENVDHIFERDAPDYTEQMR